MIAASQPPKQPSLTDSVKHISAIADGVVHISKAMKGIESGPLKMETLIILIAAETKMSKSAIKKVISSLSQLEELYVKPRSKKESN